MTRWLAWLSATFALHFIWEMWQAKWFASMTGLPFWTATGICLRASAGDLAITLVAFAVAAGISGALLWPVTEPIRAPAIAFVAVGLTITIAIEIIALRTGRWTYDPSMPTLFGIGLLPLAQWSILPLLEVALFRVIWRYGNTRGTVDRGQ